MECFRFTRSTTGGILGTPTTRFDVGSESSARSGSLVLRGNRAVLEQNDPQELLTLRRSVRVGKLLRVTETWNYEDGRGVFATYENSWKLHAEFVLDSGDSYQVRLHHGDSRRFEAVWFKNCLEEAIMELSVECPRGRFAGLDRIPLAGTLATSIPELRTILALLLFMHDATERLYRD